MTARDAPRVAFSELIERGMILPGARLVDSKKRHGALVRADGAIMLGDKVGSIHRIGAVAQGAEACNGWTFWHVETKKRLEADRRAARRNPLRNGGGLGFTQSIRRHSGMRPLAQARNPYSRWWLWIAGSRSCAPWNDPLHKLVACASRRNLSMEMPSAAVPPHPDFCRQQEQREILMLKFYFNGAPNPNKVALFLEESGLPYELVPVDTRKGDQFKPEFLKVNPNGKVPAIDDDGVFVFDSNAILLYLAEKTGKFLPPNTPANRAQLLSWLMFVASGVGPYSGQAVHFKHCGAEGPGIRA